MCSLDITYFKEEATSRKLDSNKSDDVNKNQSSRSRNKKIITQFDKAILKTKDKINGTIHGIAIKNNWQFLKTIKEAYKLSHITLDKSYSISTINVGFKALLPGYCWYMSQIEPINNLNGLSLSPCLNKQSKISGMCKAPLTVIGEWLGINLLLELEGTHNYRIENINNTNKNTTQSYFIYGLFGIGTEATFGSDDYFVNLGTEHTLSLFTITGKSKEISKLPGTIFTIKDHFKNIIVKNVLVFAPQFLVFKMGIVTYINSWTHSRPWEVSNYVTQSIGIDFMEVVKMVKSMQKK